MKEQIEHVSTLLKGGDFEEITEFISSNKVEFKTFHSAFKIANKGLSIPNRLTNNPNFWRSSILCYFLEDFMSSSAKIPLLESYFQKNENLNISFNKVLIEHYFDEFKRFFKLCKSHRHTDFMKNLDELSKIPAFLTLAVFCQEMETIRKEELTLELEEESDNQKLILIPFDKVLLGIVHYHDSLMQNIDIVQNMDLQTMYDVAICHEAERIINVFKKLRDKSEIKCIFNDPDKLQAEWAMIRPTHKFENRNEPILTDEYVRTNEILNRGLQRQIITFRLETYLSGFADFPNPFDILSIKQNEEYRRYRFNDYKSRMEELFFLSNTPKVGRLNAQERTKFLQKICSFYGIPLKLLDSLKHSFDMPLAYAFMDSFSSFKSPLGQSFIKTEEGFLPIANLNEPDENFKTCFGSNEHISLIKRENLLDGIGKYFGLNQYEAENLLEQLSIDIFKDVSFKGFFKNPFIVLKDRVYWLGRLLKNRNWSVILRNKIRVSNFIDVTDRKRISKGLEEVIQDLFIGAGYKVMLKKELREFKLSSGESGEMDLFAYKNGEVIIAEVKSGTIFDEPESVSEKEISRLEGEAAEQLEKVNTYLKEAWGNKIKYHFESKKSYEDLKIYSFIITDFFDGDMKIYKNTYPKISLLELYVILKQGKEKLYKMAVQYLPLTDRANPENNKILNGIKWDLWNGRTSFSIDVLKDCIENNVVWRDLENFKAF